MRVMNVLVWRKLASFDVEPHLLVRIAERHSFASQTIHLLHREHRIVDVVVKNMLVHLHLINNVCSHLQAVLQFVERWKEHLLDNLQVAEVTHRQVVHDEHDGLRQRLQFVAFRTCQFKHVRILLVRHDTRTRRTVVGQLHKTKVLTVEHTRIERHLRHRSSYACHRECHIALRLSASHLRIHHVVVHRVEAQQVRSHLAVERKRRTIAGSRTQRIAVGYFPSRQQILHIVNQPFSVSAKPQTETRRHGHLQMRVARHQHILVAVALLNQLVEELLGELGYLTNLVADEQLQIDEHLVVP